MKKHHFIIALTGISTLASAMLVKAFKKRAKVYEEALIGEYLPKPETRFMDLYNELFGVSKEEYYLSREDQKTFSDITENF